MIGNILGLIFCLFILILCVIYAWLYGTGKLTIKPFNIKWVEILKFWVE